MRVFGAMEVSASGLTAERLRLDLIANNIANANTTRTPDGGPYRRQLAVLQSRQGPLGGALAAGGSGGIGGFGPALRQVSSLAGGSRLSTGQGVQVAAIVRDPSPPVLRFDPSHPDANPDGYVELPNVNIVSEMTDLITATRAYEANVTALNAAKQMLQSALQIGRA